MDKGFMPSRDYNNSVFQTWTLCTDESCLMPYSPMILVHLQILEILMANYYFQTDNII